MAYDYIIVGGGSAGCVLAARLSENPRISVLLIEAGVDYGNESVPPRFLDSFPGYAYTDQRATWSGLRVTVDAQADATQGMRPYEQAKLLGGGSMINGQLANRGYPEDYEQWVAEGAQGWGWEQVLPYFKKLETDLDHAGPLHGSAGPLRIRRVPTDHWSGHARAVEQALSAQGSAFIADQNGSEADGHFPLAIANDQEQRVSVAGAYLDNAVRSRRNLRILPQAEVTELLFEQRRCVGVQVLTRDGFRQFGSGEVIVSCGALHSPKLLMRSGIGDARHLAELGIPVLSDRPGVGRNLMDHPCVALVSYLGRAARATAMTRRHMVIGWRYSAGLPELRGDMFCVAGDRSAWHAIGYRLGYMLAMVNKPYSRAGTVRLRSSDWREAPQIDFRLLSDERDMRRLTDGVRRLARLHEAIDPHVMQYPMPAILGEKARQWSAVTTRNRWLTSMAAQFLDGPAPLRQLMIDHFIAGPYQLDRLLRDPEEMTSYVRSAAIGGWHASCTCKMGREGDHTAVTDPEGRVHGVGGLRVVDASLFPVIPRANTNLPTIMAAEKISAAIRRRHQAMAPPD